MKRISLKNLQNQVSQASNFYGRSDISGEDFFRYKISPFLAKIFVGVTCNQNLFSKISKDISITNKEFLKSKEIDLIASIKIIEGENKKFIYKTYFIFTLALLLFIFLIKDGIFYILYFGIFILLILNSITEKIESAYTSNQIEYKNLVNYLGEKFTVYQNSVEYWENLSWQNFEHEVTKRLRNFGYDAVNTKLSGDEGVDIVINNHDKKFIIQCKAIKNKIGPAYIRDFIGTISIQKALGGIIISLNGFSSGSLEVSDFSNLHLFSVQDFILMDKEQIGKIIGW